MRMRILAFLVISWIYITRLGGGRNVIAGPLDQLAHKTPQTELRAARPHAHHATPTVPIRAPSNPRAPMAKGGGGQREGNALKTAVIVAGGLALAWVTVETAFRPFMDRLRAAVSRSTDTARDSDQEEAPAPAPEAEEEKAPAPEEPSAPPAPAAVEEKVAELEEKVEEGAAAAADKAE